MNRIFIGYDERQIVAYTVLQSSIIRHSSKPVAITPLVMRTLPLKRTGLTPFTWTRFLVPYLCGFEGFALFMDADVLVLGDIEEIFALARADPSKAVWAYQNPKPALKFEWASVMLFNCAHEDNKQLTPVALEQMHGLHKIAWTGNIGQLPEGWNHLVGYDVPIEKPKLLHYTQGVPIWPETINGGYADEWQREAHLAGSAKQWLELMGNSVHYEHVMARYLAEQKEVVNA